MTHTTMRESVLTDYEIRSKLKELLWLYNNNNIIYLIQSIPSILKSINISCTKQFVILFSNQQQQQQIVWLINSPNEFMLCYLGMPECLPSVSPLLPLSLSLFKRLDGKTWPRNCCASLISNFLFCILYFIVAVVVVAWVLLISCQLIENRTPNTHTNWFLIVSSLPPTS